MKKNATALLASIDPAPLAAGLTAAVLFLATPVGWDLVVGRHAPAADPLATLAGAAAPPLPRIEDGRSDAPIDHGIDIATTAPPAPDGGPYPEGYPEHRPSPPAVMAGPPASLLLAGLGFQVPEAAGDREAIAGDPDRLVPIFQIGGPDAVPEDDPAADATIATSAPVGSPPRVPTVLGAPIMVALEAGRPVIDVLFAPPTARAMPVAPLDKSTDRVVSVDTADKLVEMFDGENFSWDAVRQGRLEEVPRLFVSAFPSDIDEIDTIDLRKRVFFDSLLPLVLAVNERVLADRARLQRMIADLEAGVPPRAADGPWLAALARDYEAGNLALDDLLVRVDIVPPSMALAQAAVESGWGTSGLARNGNALFGQIVAPGVDGIPAADGDHGFAAFETLKDSAASYVRNLNTHPAYAAFRSARASQRAAGEWLDGYRLMGELTAYSELGMEYIDYVRVVIRANDLQAFDRVRLRPVREAQTGSEPESGRPVGSGSPV